MNKMITYIENYYNDQNIFKGYFGYSKAAWLKDYFDIQTADYEIKETYRINKNKGVTVREHFTNDIGEYVYDKNFRTIFDTYDGQVKQKKLIGYNSVNYFAP